MRTRFTWIAAIIVLVAIGFLIACSTKYSSSSNGLVVVPTQGTTEIPGATAVMETFTLNLANGQASQINNVNGFLLRRDCRRPLSLIRRARTHT